MLVYVILRTLMSYRFDRDELFSLAGWLSRLAADLEAVALGVPQALTRVHRSSNSVGALGSVSVGCDERAEDLVRRAVFLGEISADRWSAAWGRRSELLDLWRQIETFPGSDNDPRLDALLRRSVSNERAWVAALDDLAPAQVAALAAALPAEIGRRMAWSAARA